MAHTGTVKLFNTSKGFGFISAEDGTEIFAHIAGLADGQYLQTGDAVTFDVEESKIKPGQMQATNIKGGTGGSSRAGGAQATVTPTGSIQGTCKSFNELKGFGFIVGDGDSDIFIYCRDLVDGRVPMAGDTLVFDAEESAKEPGKVVAKNVTGGTGGFVGKGKDGKGKGKDGGKGGMMEQMMQMMGGGGGGDGTWGKASWSGGGKGGGPYGNQGGGDAPLSKREQQMMGMMMGMAAMIKKQNKQLADLGMGSGDNSGGTAAMAMMQMMGGLGGGGGGGGNDPMEMIMKMMGGNDGGGSAGAGWDASAWQGGGGWQDTSGGKGGFGKGMMQSVTGKAGGKAW